MGMKVGASTLKLEELLRISFFESLLITNGCASELQLKVLPRVSVFSWSLPRTNGAASALKLEELLGN